MRRTVRIGSGRSKDLRERSPVVMGGRCSRQGALAGAELRCGALTELRNSKEAWGLDWRKWGEWQGMRLEARGDQLTHGPLLLNEMGNITGI